jgi:hypothetical protein
MGDISSITISPTKTTYLNSGAPSTPQAGTLLKYGRLTASNNARTLFHFSLSGIPAGATITGATLAWYVITPADAGHSGVIYPLTQTAWTRAGATWLTYDGVNPWASAGGDYTDTIDLGGGITEPRGAGFLFRTAAGWLLVSSEPLRQLVEDAYDLSGQLHLLIKKSDETTPIAFPTEGTGPWNEAADPSNVSLPFDSIPYLTVTFEVEPVRLTHTPVEVLQANPVAAKVRVTQTPVEVLQVNPVAVKVRLTHAVIELLRGIPDAEDEEWAIVGEQFVAGVIETTTFFEYAYCISG